MHDPSPAYLYQGTLCDQHMGELEDWTGPCDSPRLMQGVLQGPPTTCLVPTIEVCLLCESTVVRIFVYNANPNWDHVIDSQSYAQNSLF